MEQRRPGGWRPTGPAYLCGNRTLTFRRMTHQKGEFYRRAEGESLTYQRVMEDTMAIHH